VKLEDDATRTDLERINGQNNATTDEDLPRSQVNVVDLPSDLPVREAISRYEASPDVEFAEPDFVLKPSQTTSANDPRYPSLYGLNNTGQNGGTADADIDAPEAWNATTGDPGTVVAVIDEGVDINHPDLRNNIWVNPDEVPNNGVDDDGNGYIDDVNGYDFFNDDATVYDPDPVSGAGDDHGTHVAGTIAAEGNNNLGVVGVNWRTRIMPLKFPGPNGGSTSDAIKALDYAVAEGAKISNNSWGGGGSPQALLEAIKKADASGHLFVTAAGNGGADGIGDDNDATPQYPSSYNSPNIISVAATNNRDALASFSNYGFSSVDVAAPGVGILSTVPNNAYASYSGTSMATPRVTGAAALLRSSNPTLDDAQLKARILESAENKTNLQARTATGGRLNAQAALTKTMAPDPVAQDTAGPAVASVRPSSGSRTRDRTPAIAATVSDDRTELAKGSIQLYVDEAEKMNFSYDPANDRLTYTSARLSYASHTVRIVATDAAGNATTKSWSFRVVR
ncbi:MAG: S8 family serine peptidase, partial [Rubrobacter sp.]|nr:S8 family serine peptidase [Rubrobacter sp.]